MSEKFLITGGQGFIGAWIVRQLLEEGAPLVVFDQTPSNAILSQVLDPERLPEIERVFGDITDTAKVQRVVAGHQITRIIHLAGLQVPACKANPVSGAMVNVIGTLNVFEAARASQGGVASLVYASSAAIAGDSEDYQGPVRDQDAPLPRTHYGVFKSASEGNARVYWTDHHLPSIGLRPCTVYGVGREVGLTSAPTKAIKAAVLRRGFQIPFSDKTSFVYVEDLARIFIEAARSSPGAALALNIRGIADTVENFISHLEAALPSSKGKMSCSGDPLPIAYDYDESGLEKLLGAGNIPRTSLADGVRRTAERFQRLAEQGRLSES